jgi:AcrR family transcriptional regulator
MNRKVEQGDATRRELICAAIDLFTEHGFADTSTAEIVHRPNVTRALYHHFADKQAMFEGALAKIEQELRR